ASPGVIHVSKGEMFVVGNQDLKIEAGTAKIEAGNNALYAVKVIDGATSIKSCSGPGKLTVHVGNQTVRLSMGQEAVILSRGKTMAAMRDGIGRRAVKIYQNGANQRLLVTEYSLPSYMMNSTELIKMARSQTKDDKTVVVRLLRSAVVINYALKHGPYSTQ